MPAKTKLIATTLAVAAAGSAALAGPASAAKTRTSLSIQTVADGVSGFVKSSKSSCHSGRNVKIYRKVSGPDKKVGSDIATPNQDGSQYKVSLSRAGRYYAKVHATSKCKGKTSRSVSFSPSEGEDARAAHTLTKEEATEATERLARRGIERGEGKFVKARVRCTVLFPHRVRCSIGYFTKKSLAKNEVRCIDRWMVSFNAHSKSGNSRRIFFSLVDDNPLCR